MKDVLIIGAGISGVSIAFQLAKSGLDVLVLEAGGDVAGGASRANSAVVHSGYDPLTGTLMAKYNVQGNLMLHEYAKRFNIPFKEVGSLTLALHEDQMDMLQALYERGVANGVSGLELIDKRALHALEPNVNEDACGALHAKTAGIVGAFELVVALAENARRMGAQFIFNSGVTAIEKQGDTFFVKTANGAQYSAAAVVNAAGVNADKINALAGGEPFVIDAVKGEYFVLDKTEGGLVKSVIFSLPSAKGKGVICAPTFDGNIIIGPNATPIDDKADTAVTAAGMVEVERAAAAMVRGIDTKKSIRNFAGVRAHAQSGDFIIGQDKNVKNFYNAAGIKSPGLTAAIAFAKALADEVSDGFSAAKQKAFALRAQQSERTLSENAYKCAELFINEQPETQAQLLAADSRYGAIVCRCENVTEGDIVAALQSPLTPNSLGGLKRRVRAGSGRCQGGFCAQKIIDIIARERGIAPCEVLLENEGSYITLGALKGVETCNTAARDGATCGGANKCGAPCDAAACDTTTPKGGGAHE